MPELLHPGVYVLEISSGVHTIEGVSTSTAAFIGVTEKGPLPGTRLPNGEPATPVMVTSFTDYIRQFGGFRQDSFMTYSVRAFFDNGGRRLYIVRVAGPNAVASVNRDGPIAFSAASPGVWGDKFSIDILESSIDNTTDNFKIVVFEEVDGVRVPVEQWDNVTHRNAASANSEAQYARAVINSRSQYIAITNDFTERPSPTPGIALSGGDDDLGSIDNSTFVGGVQGEDGGVVDPALTGTGLRALDKLTDVNLIAIPGLGDAGVVSEGMSYCKTTRQLADCFFIGDMGTFADVSAARRPGAQPANVSSIDDARQFATTNAELDKSVGDHGAIYYPWVWSDDPRGQGRNPRILLPPSGFMAGIYARTDNSRGVFKAPAGTEAGVAGALAVATTVSDVEQDRLNPVKVNVIRTVPGSGIVVWGTRTIGSNVEWKYIPVRRMAIYLRTSIYYGIQWAVFEPNDEPLWASLRLNIRAFMLTQFRAGAFQGSKPDDAFFVKCDSSTTTQFDIDLGIVNILVGFAPLKPAEFVVLRLQQKVNQVA